MGVAGTGTACWGYDWSKWVWLSAVGGKVPVGMGGGAMGMPERAKTDYIVLSRLWISGT